jgi:hypothetical protein
MEDTEAAIFRLFEAFPQVDVIDIRVLGPTAESLMFAGKVCRADLDTSHSMRSVRMRLRRLGVSYHFAESLLSPVDSHADRFS